MRHQRFVTVDFRTDALGYARPIRATEQPSADQALRHVALVALMDAGAIAFSRVVDEANGRYKQSDLLATTGDVDLSALAR